MRTPSLIDCEVEIVRPGGKLILAGDDNTPRYAITALRDRRTDGVVWQFGSPFDENWETEANIQERVAPYSGQRVWLRLIQGAGFVRAWTSIDGLSWGRPCEPMYDTEGFCTRLGLMIPKSDRPRGLILRRVVIRELPLLRDRAGVETLAKVPHWKPAKPRPGLAEWQAWADSTRPADVSEQAWRRACGVKALAYGLSPQCGTALQARLLDDVFAKAETEADPIATRLAWLRETAWIANTSYIENELPVADRFTPRYLNTAIESGLRGEERAWSRLWPEFVQAPFTSPSGYAQEWAQLARRELLRAIYGGDPARVRELTLTMQPIYPRSTLMSWSEFWLATKHPQFRLPSSDGFEEHEQSRIDRRHPLVEEISKESYNTMAELSSAIGSKAYRDAARIITQSAATESGGLLPDESDSQLLVSLPAAVDLAMRRDPELRETLIREFGEVGLLRYRKAELEADAGVMRILADQYPGTLAAGLAHAWLGERAMAGGDFDAATTHFETATTLVTPDLATGLAARRRLASALAGREFGTPTTASVAWGESQIAAADFETMIRDLLKERGRTSLTRAADIPAVFPKLANLTGKRIAATDGDAGDKVGEFPEALNAAMEGGKRLDWVARQTAVVPAGDLMIWTNRYQIAAYRRDNGERVWRVALDNDHGKAHDWPLIPHRPLVAGDRVFVRRSSRSGPELVAFDLKTQGKLVWRSPSAMTVIADPLAVDDEVRVLCLQRSEQDAQIVLTGFDPNTGAVTSQRTLCSVRAGWDEHHTAQWTVVGDRFYGILTGFVFCCDTRGKMLWARRQIWFAPREDRDWTRQWMQPPVMSDERMFVAQPGVKTVEALDPTTGRLLWRQVLPSIRRILGVNGGLVLVQTDEAVLALNVADGHLLWQSPQSRLLDAFALADTAPRLMVAYEVPAKDPKDKTRSVELAVIDLKDGRTLETRAFGEVKGDAPHAGPLVAVGDKRWWLFTGNGDKEPHRAIQALGE
ncbi:MAG: PQQ-binding-like beta-propeller repeat protein [Pirellulales bacterium]